MQTKQNVSPPFHLSSPSEFSSLFASLNGLQPYEKGAACSPSNVFFLLSLVSISVYLARLFSPAYQSGLLYFSF
jgi:hypothetical protein